MAEVFLARREGPSGFEKQLVVKRLLPHLSRRARFTEMFLREARLSALIDHPNFVHVSAFGEEDGQYYLAMEFVDGVTIKQLSEQIGSFSPGAAARIAIDLLDALNAIHNAVALDGRPLHLVHRDVTPSNVMLTRSGTVKLLDLGIAISEDDGAPARAGTRKYMSPEQARGAPLDARSDLYCVGLLLKSMLPSALPPPLEAIVRRLLEEDPEARPSSAREVQDALEQFAHSRGREGTRGALAKLASRVVRAHRPATAHPGTASIADSLVFDQSRTLQFVAPRSSWRAWFGALLLAALSLAASFAFVDERSEATPRPPIVEATRVAEIIEPPPPEAPRLKKKKPKKRKIVPRAPSYLNVDARPWAIVFVDGRRLGQTPLSRVEIPSGDHRLKLINPERGLEASHQIHTEPGEVHRIRERFEAGGGGLTSRSRE
jgi:eukaryotic-like serine/threonine-protein kinase